jgi:hypothetical protein
MPLHGERERRCVDDADGFDQTVRRHGFDGEAGAELRDALLVQRVDVDVVAAAGERVQQAARRQMHDVRGAVLRVHRRVVVLAVIVEARHFVHALMQRAAADDVQLLKAAADGEHRHARVERGAQQRQRRRVAGRIVLGAGRARLAAVSMRLDVRVAAGKQQAVDRREHVVHRLAIAERGQHHRKRVRAVDDRRDVLVADRMRRVSADLREVGSDADERFPFHDVYQLCVGRVRAVPERAGTQARHGPAAARNTRGR